MRNSRLDRAAPGSLASPAAPGREGRKYRSPRPYLLLVTGVLLLTLCALPPSAARAALADVGVRQTTELFLKIPGLNAQQRTEGQEVIPTLSYTSQRVYRAMCRLPGIDFTTSKEAWRSLLSQQISYEHLLCFEQWCQVPGAKMALTLSALSQINTLNYEAGKSFRAYCALSRITAPSTLKTIPILNELADMHNRAVQQILRLPQLTATEALEALGVIIFLRDNQAQAAGAMAAIATMDAATLHDALPLIRQLRDDDAGNAAALFSLPGISPATAWRSLASYFANPPQIQEQLYYQLPGPDKQTLLAALYTGGEEIIWKINNLHAITDRFGIEISTAELARYPAAKLSQRFALLSPAVQVRLQNNFAAHQRAGATAEMIALLKSATAADRLATASSLTAANIYCLLARGGELYDSSFRDILVPVLKQRITTPHGGKLLSFLRATDPESRLVSDFIISLAQKCKLLDFFPPGSGEQRDIIELVAHSAFADEDSILLFSATFSSLLEALTPPVRSFLLEKIISAAESGPPRASRLLSALLQYYLQESPRLLTEIDRVAIQDLLARRGSLDFSRYEATPFAEWTADQQLSSISVFHPDDDGHQSFCSYALRLLSNGYRLSLCEPFTLSQLSPAHKLAGQQLLAAAQTQPGAQLSALFSAMSRDHFAIIFTKQINNIAISHAIFIYADKQKQEQLLERFLRGGHEMFAQRGHSYWRSEQIIDPMNKLRESGRITAADLTAKQRFLSLGSCGGVKAYTSLHRLFSGRVDILATIDSGRALVNDPYNKNFFEIIAKSSQPPSWRDIAGQSAHIFAGDMGREYIQPGSLPSLLHKLLEEERSAQRATSSALSH